jgi:small subunit ribosomal protein S17e
MGRIKTKLIKRITHKLIERNPYSFKNDFNYNKQRLLELAEIRSKKLRNSIAGYLTRLTKKQKS